MPAAWTSENQGMASSFLSHVSAASPDAQFPPTQQGFADLLAAEVDRLDRFYCDHDRKMELDLAELQRRAQPILAESVSQPQQGRARNTPEFNQQLFFSCYRKLIMLLNFAKLNFIALDVICRYHDEKLKDTLHERFFRDRWHLRTDALHLFEAEHNLLHDYGPDDDTLQITDSDAGALDDVAYARR